MMTKYQRLFLLFIGLLLEFSINTSYVYAQSLPQEEDQFDIEYDISYKALEDGETQVSQVISITNKSNDIVATKYSLTIKQMEIYDLSAEDEKGDMDIDEQRNDSSITVNVKFNKLVVGKDKNYKFTVKYKSKSITNKVGDIWNINIPRVQANNLTKSYNIKLYVPKTFGPRIFISPKPIEELEEKSNYIYKFGKEDLETRGISASFGKFQTLNFQINYELINNAAWFTQQEIALPMDIPHTQQINIKKLSPEPQKVRIDSDGNLLASYRLGPKERLTIKLSGTVRILGNQINPTLGGTFDKIPLDLVRLYTQEKKYWEVSNPAIQQLANSLKDPNSTVSQNAYKAYQYIVDNLEYNFDIVSESIVERHGAAIALQEKTPWGCMEFTDLFVALTRAMGIPSRELNGYAIAQSENILPMSINLYGGDLLHSWPQFFDPNFGWVSVDPTWGNTSGLDYFTKLDTNHFAFVVKGLDSEFPYPAGTYKSNPETRQIHVDFTKASEDSEALNVNLVLYKALDLNPINLLTGKRKYYIANEGGVTVYSDLWKQSAKITSTGIYADLPQPLPPYSSIDIYLPKDATTIQYVDFQNEETTKKFEISQKSSQQNTILLVVLIISGILVVLGLCMIVYYLKVLAKSPNTSLLHRIRHLLDRGLSRNRN